MHQIKEELAPGISSQNTGNLLLPSDECLNHRPQPSIPKCVRYVCFGEIRSSALTSGGEVIVRDWLPASAHEVSHFAPPHIGPSLPGPLPVLFHHVVAEAVKRCDKPW